MSDLTLGTAYVQIMPSAKGIQGSISKLLDPEAESAGKSAGAKAGKSIGGMIRGAIIAAGIGQAIKSAFNEGASLQQNLGGTEAVFGNFAKNIESSATQAYKNMGLSASEYMSTANKMGSLFQGSGLDQQRSLELTSESMQRAADVASVMGIDTTMAMESIAGAAKGNFTMMDNLGVAMNATTLQAYALEKGVNFKWNTATNAQKAELAMQMFMDRTSQYQGNFARESEETLSGSLGAMSAVFKDFLGNLTLGRDVTPSLQALAKTSVTFLAKNFVPAIIDIIKALPKVIITIISELGKELIPIGSSLIENISSGMSNSLPVIYEKTLEGLSKIKDTITTELPNMLNKGVEIVTNIALGILNSLPKVIQSTGPLLSGVINTVASSFPAILESGKTLITNMISGIIASLPSIISSMVEVLAQVLFTIASNLPSFLQKGLELIGEVAAGLIRAIPTLLSKIPTILKDAANAFLSYDWLGIGVDIIAGIVKGLVDAGGKILDALLDIAASAWNSVLSFFGIASPSKKFIWVGEMLDKGLAEGIVGHDGVVKKAMNDITEMTTGTVESDLSIRASKLNRSDSFQRSGVINSEGYKQEVNIYSPETLNPSEVARQTRNATRHMVLAMNGKG